MRLKRVETGHRLRAKVKLGMIRLVSGEEPVDVVKTLSYRPELFGRPYSDVLHQVMRGPSEWGVGERELFAMFVSQQNECRF